MKIFFYFLILFSLLFSCSSNSENSEDDSPLVVDETAPSISLSNKPDVIEVATDLSFKIEDESDQVSTVISVNGEEVLTTAEKNIVFTLNPFDYAIGDTELKIVSSDANGNETSRMFSFELKKLLIRITNPIPSSLVNDSEYSFYISVNDMNGKLLSHQKVEDNTETVDFYADDNFSESEFNLTRYGIYESLSSPDALTFTSASNLLPGTVGVLNKESAPVTGGSINPLKIVNLQILDLNGFAKMRTHNADMINLSSNQNGTDYVFGYREEDNNDIMYLFPIVNSNEAIEDYEYFFIKDYSKTIYEKTDFVKPDSFKIVKLPINGENYSLSMKGFYSEKDYEENNFHQIFTYGNDITEIIKNEGVNAPFLSEFQVFESRLTMTFEEQKKRFVTLQKGFVEEFFIPDMDVVQNGNSVSFTGNYDYSSFSYSISNLEVLFSWGFSNSPTNSVIKIPFYDFEFPPEVSAEISKRSFSIRPDEIGDSFNVNSFSCSLYRFDNPSNYPDSENIFPPGLRERNNNEYTLTVKLDF